MSRRQQNILIFIGIGVILVVLALLFPVKPLPTIEAGPKAIASIEIGGYTLPISNSMLVAWSVTILLCLVAFACSRNMKLIPSGLQNIMEAVVETINGLVSDQAGERGRRFFPIVATIFLFLILVNITSIIPGFGSIGIWQDVTTSEGHVERELVPLFRTSSADLNNAFALALISVIMTQIYSIRALGLSGYLLRWFNIRRLGRFFLSLFRLRPRQGMGGNLGWGIMDFVIGIVELFSEFVKIITFTFRLYGNMFAGEVILVIMAYLLAQILPIPFYMFESFVGVIQAFVFAILTLVFMSMATIHHGEGESNVEL